MLGRIALFEFRYQLRRPIAWISFLVFAALGFAEMTLTAFQYVTVVANAPVLLTIKFGTFSILAMFLSIASLADVALRDAETRMEQIIGTQPVAATSYMAARFAGAFAVACLTYLGTIIGFIVATKMPWVTPGSVGPFRLASYLVPLVTIAIPNLFVTGALFFTVATLTRSLLMTYLSALGLFIICITMRMLLSAASYRTLGALVDPFAQMAVLTTAAYWTNAEWNTQLVPLTGVLLWNRVLWVSIGAGALALSFIFARRERRPAPRRLELVQVAAAPVVQRPVIVPGGAGTFDQLAVRTRHEVASVLRSWTFYALLLLAISACIAGLVVEDQALANPQLPLTYVMIDVVASSFGLAALLVPIAYGGELIWRDRQTKIAAIIDATPTPTTVFLVSKIIAVAIAVLLLVAAIMAVGIGYQLINGVTDIDFGFYAAKLLGVWGLPAIMLAVLAILVQTMVNHKFIGLLIMLVLVVGTSYAAALGINNELLYLFRVPDFPLSDMNGYGHYLSRLLWFSAYWVCLAIVVALVAYVLWARGTGSLWNRIKLAPQTITPAIASVAGVALAGAAVAGGYIYWNIRVANTYVSSAQAEQIAFDYEAKYRGAEKQPQPRVVDISMEVDLYPEQRGYRSRGRYALTNRSDKPIELVHVKFGLGTVSEVALQDAELADKQLRFNVFEFRPRTPFLPGETRALSFAVSASTPGFQGGSDDSPVVYNGSFVHSVYLAPVIGVQPSSYLQSEARRRAHGLDPLPGMAPPDNAEEAKRNAFSSDSDFVPFAITVSTSADQTALAPGDLEREWTQDGRRFFSYRLAKPSTNFWSVVSGRYTVARDKWNDVDLAVYYEAKHGTNVPRMLEGMKQALAYYTTNFSAFPHKQLRIVEFPRYQTFAQSFPTMIPFSESIGFILDLRESVFDYVWYVTAHEVAHQWWGHQIVPANVEGAQFLSESLAEYSALMVAEHRYGAHKMRTFLKRKLDTYLRARNQISDERPLTRVPMTQAHVHYEKGSVSLYALKDMIGEAAFNRILAKLLHDYAYKGDPYPTSLNFLALLRAEAGPAYDQLITDLFEKITLWDLRVTDSEATETPDGKWRVRVEIRARKLDANGKGEETEVPLDQPIDVGLFAADPDKPEFGDKDVIALEKRKITTGTQTVEFVVDRKPDFVGVDPYVKLISRNAGNNVAPLGKKPGA